MVRNSQGLDEMDSIGIDDLTFCDICGREILCDDEIGDIEQDTYILGRKRFKSITVWCVDCHEEKKETHENRT